MRSVSEIESYGLPRPSITEIAGSMNIIIFGNKDTIKETNLSSRGIEWNIKKLKKREIETNWLN